MNVNVKVCRHKKVWHIFASLRGLAGAEEPLKEAVAASIKAAAERGWIDEKKAQVDRQDGGPTCVQHEG